MAEKRRFIDVWIIDSNTVYREVPFQVVADWVQQGRLLEDDKIRPSGTAEWFRVGGSPDFTPYLPRAEPFRADDQAEALEPVELDFRYRHRHDDEDDDVDMIPLIDVSLVLLIFFMLTAPTVGALFIPTPEATYGHIASNPEEIVLGINLVDPDSPPVFSMAVGQNPPEEDDKDLKSVDALVGRLRAFLDAHPGRQYEVSINAHGDVKAGVVRDLTVKLEDRPFKSRIVKFYGVSEPKNPS
jgi:biopolymer transport protein ExbD